MIYGKQPVLICNPAVMLCLAFQKWIKTCPLASLPRPRTAVFEVTREARITLIAQPCSKWLSHFFFFASPLRCLTTQQLPDHVDLNLRKNTSTRYFSLYYWSPSSTNQTRQTPTNSTSSTRPRKPPKNTSRTAAAVKQ